MLVGARAGVTSQTDPSGEDDTTQTVVTAFSGRTGRMIRSAYRLSHDGVGTFAPQVGTNARSLAEPPAAGLRQDSSRMWWR